MNGSSGPKLHLLLREKYKVEVPVSFWGDTLWLRVSAQVYNDAADYCALEDAIRDLAGTESNDEGGSANGHVNEKVQRH